MKKLFVFAVLCLFAAAAVAQQSLGDVARANRAKKHAPANTNLDDDNFARSSAPAEAPAAKADAASKDAGKTDDKKDDGKDSKKEAADAQSKKSEQLKSQIDSEKKEITALQRELDVAEREARLRAAAYYADAGVMLRDQAKFAEDSRKAQAEIESKKQALTAAQEKLADLQEQARKAGLPNSE
jgi:hypothetical protein